MGKLPSKPEMRELQEQTDTIVQMLRRRGVLPDLTITDENRRAARQKQHQECFHNTLMLLKNYRNIAWMVECFPEAVAEELEQPFETVDALLERAEISSNFGDRRLENRLVGVEQTRLLLDRVNEALTVLRRKPENGQLLYDLIYLTFISSETLTIQELLYRLNLSSRHYYRLREQAITVLSLRLWAAPNSNVDLWLELLKLGKDKE